MADQVDIVVNETIEEIDVIVNETVEQISITANNAAAWGSIAGTLSNQTDLQAALDAKEDSLGFTPANELIEINGAGLLNGQGGDLTANREFTLNNSDIDHDQLNNFEANEHIDWTNASEDFETSEDVTAKEFNGFGIMPIGSVTAWLKSFTNTPALPSGWAECNGQVINDADSVYNGQNLPNLNGSGGIQRFLRGSTTSGSEGGSVDHMHTYSGGGGGSTSSIVTGKTTAQSGSGQNVTSHTPDHVHTFNFNFGGSTGLQMPFPVEGGAPGSAGTDMLPPYYEVVYIMRIK